MPGFSQLSLLPMEWTFEPSVLAGLAMLCAAYALTTGRLRQRYGWGQPVSAARQAAFYAGMLIVFVALCSPLDELGDGYLFSAHMLQHLLLTFIAPPLWLLGLPAWLPERLFARDKPRQILRILIAPLAAFIIFNAVMWAWHIPAAYNATLASEGLHIVEHLTFMGSALVGWAPVLIAAPLNPLPPPARGLYLLASTFSCTALAAMFTFSNRVLYPFYAASPAAALISAVEDQRMGGILMWLTGDTIFVAAILVVVGVWLSRQQPLPG